MADRRVPRGWWGGGVYQRWGMVDEYLGCTGLGTNGLGTTGLGISLMASPGWYQSPG